MLNICPCLLAVIDPSQEPLCPLPQVFCALSPALSSASCTALLAALHKCLQSATAQVGGCLC